MGVFRRRWGAFYTPRRKLPPAIFVPGITVVVSKVHPSRNITLKNETFRVVLWQYYSPKRVLYTSIFVPGITNAVQKVHPTRNTRLRNNTFRPSWKQFYQPKRVLPASQFVPGILVAVSRVHPSRNPHLRNNTFRQPSRHYYQPNRVLSPSLFAPGITPVISKVHPERNPHLRDKTFRPPWKHYYQPKHTLSPPLFVPGITNAVQKVHPSRNPQLRDNTFRQSSRQYYQLKRVLPSSAPALGQFPTVVTTNTSSEPSDTTSHTVDLPSGITSGDLLVAILAIDAGDAPITTFPAGWTEIKDTSETQNFVTLAVAYRDADGGEGGSISVTTSVSEKSAHATYRLTNHDTGNPPQISTGASGQDTDADPDSLTPTGGSKDYLWFALVAVDGSNSTGPWSVDVAPTDYANLVSHESGSATNGSTIGVARRELTAASENPGIFTLESTAQWFAATLAIHPIAARLTPIVVSKVHPSRNLQLRDNTFRQPSRQYYQPKHVLPPSLFVPGTLVAVQKVHPTRNTGLRDRTFRPSWKQYYQPRHVLPPSQFVPGTLWTKHPKLKNVWARNIEHRYYKLRRVLPISVTPAVDISVPMVSKIHPSRNIKLRDTTFRRLFRGYYKHKKIILPAIPCSILTPDCDGTIDGVITHDVDKTPPFYTHIDEDPNLPGSDWIANDLTETGGNAFICVPNMPDDFVSITSLIVRYSRQAIGFSNDTATLFAQIFASDESTAYTDEITLADQTDTTQITETGAFTINATGLAASRNEWNESFIRFRWAYTQVAGPDNAQIRLFAAELEVCYVPVVAIPVAIQKVHPSRNPQLRDKTFRSSFNDYYQLKRVLPSLVVGAFITNAVQKVHPSRNIRLRDTTFSPTWKQYYQPKHVLPPVVFVPGITVVISKVHPSRTLRLRDTTFRQPFRQYYQPKHVLPSSLFVPGIFRAKHPRLRNVWTRKTDQRYYRLKRVIPPSVAVVVNVLVAVISKVHPSRNVRLRNSTFRQNVLQYYRHKRIIVPVIFVPGILVAISKVHPSRNMKLRDTTFRQPSRQYFRPNIVILIGESAGGFRPTFKGMFKGMYRKMQIRDF